MELLVLYPNKKNKEELATVSVNFEYQGEAYVMGEEDYEAFRDLERPKILANLIAMRRFEEMMKKK